MIVAREGLGAPGDRRRLPVLSGSQGLVVHWNGPPVPVHDHVVAGRGCAGWVRAVRRFHMDTNGWLDIAYNFVVCRHGVIFEGRGWGYRSAANGSNRGNGWGHAVMVACGDGQPPKGRQLAAVADLAALHLARYGRVELEPHRAFRSTDCPGDTLAGWVVDGRWRSMMEAQMPDAGQIVDAFLEREVTVESPWQDGGDRQVPLGRLLVEVWQRVQRNAVILERRDG